MLERALSSFRSGSARASPHRLRKKVLAFYRHQLETQCCQYCVLVDRSTAPEANATISPRMRMLQAPPVENEEFKRTSRRKLGHGAKLPRVTSPSQLVSVFGGGHSANTQSAYNVRSASLSGSSNVYASGYNFDTHHDESSLSSSSSSQYHSAHQESAASAAGSQKELLSLVDDSTTASKRSSMTQRASAFAQTHGKNRRRADYRALSMVGDVASLEREFKRHERARVGPGLWGRLVEALARSGRFQEAQEQLAAMADAGFRWRIAYARARATMKLHQFYGQLAVDEFCAWTERFLALMQIETRPEQHAEMERDRSMLPDVYISIIEQLFRKKYPNLGYSLVKHAETHGIPLPRTTIPIMTPHLIGQMDLEVVIRQSIQRHATEDGRVPGDTLRMLISACIKQSRFELALSLVDLFLDARRDEGKMLIPSENRDILFIFLVTGQLERATEALSDHYRRGSLDERVISTVLEAILIRRTKDELRKVVQQPWWTDQPLPQPLYSKFFYVCARLGDPNLAIEEFQRAALQFETGRQEMFESLLKWMALFNHIMETESLFKMIQRAGVEINGNLFAEVLRMYCQALDMHSATHIMNMIQERKVAFTDRLYYEVMRYQLRVGNYNEVLEYLTRAKSERITIAPAMMGCAIYSCAMLNNQRAAMALMEECKQLRLVSDRFLMRIWFWACGKLRAPSLLLESWHALRAIPDFILDELLWIQIVLSCCVCEDPANALSMILESLSESAFAIRLSIRYPHTLLTSTPLLRLLPFMPMRERLKITAEWNVPDRAEEQELTFRQRLNLAPRLGEGDREYFASQVREWLERLTTGEPIQKPIEMTPDDTDPIPLVGADQHGGGQGWWGSLDDEVPNKQHFDQFGEYKAPNTAAASTSRAAASPIARRVASLQQ